jgi:hypothetical protein
MTDPDIADRAFTLAEMASDDSVTMSVLAGREGRFSRAEPLNVPPVTYLAETEAPVYVLTNGKRGVGRGVKSNTVTPDGEYRTVVLVTGRRTLCLVGQRDGDEMIEIPHESVAEIRYSTGFRKHRLVLRTPRSAYHCWIHRKTDAELLERTTEFVAERQTEDPESVDDDDAASRVMYRGRPVERTADEESGDDRTTDDGTDDTTDDGTDDTTGDDEEFTVMYRGRPVDKD